MYWGLTRGKQSLYKMKSFHTRTPEPKGMELPALNGTAASFCSVWSCKHWTHMLSLTMNNPIELNAITYGVVKSVHKHSQIWDLAQAIRKTKGRNWISPVLQGSFRPADLFRPRSRKAGTFCKHLLWSLPSKQMGWSSHVSEALQYLPKHLHSVRGASGSKVAIKCTLKFGTCSLFTQFRETESHTVCSFTVK